MKGLTRWELLLASVSIAAALVYLHYNLVDAANSGFQMDWYAKIIQNEGPYPDQYRILTYYIGYYLIQAGVPFIWAFALIRFVFTAVSFYIFYRYLQHLVQPMSALLGLFALAAVMPFTYLFYGMQPADPLNMLVFFAAFMALLKEKDWLLLPLVIIGMLNRETVILIPLIYAVVRYGTVPYKRWLPGFIVMAAVAWGIYIGLKLFFGTKAPYAPTSPFHYWYTNLTDWKTWLQLIGFFNLSIVLCWRDWKEKPLFLRRLSLILPIFILIHFTVGYMREVRYFLPILAILLPLTLLNLESRFGKQTRIEAGDMD